MGKYKVISSDNHVFEPTDLWTSRIEPKFRDRAPRIVHKDNADWWFCDGQKLIGVGSATQTGRRFEDPGHLVLTDTIDNIRPGGYIPSEHVKDMDADGLDVSIIYPTVGLLMFSVPASELLTALFRVYNNWLSEFCSEYPARLKGIAMLNVDDLPTAVKELERCAKMGMAGAMITVFPTLDRMYSLPEYEPLWSAAEDLEMPLGLHISTNRPGPGQELENQDSLTPSFVCNSDHWVRMSLSHMIYGGVFERHPKLQVGSVELELSWVLHFLDRMDYTYTQRPRRDSWHRFKEDMIPSDYFHRNVFVSFQEDALGIKHREIIGINNLMWGSDYPHRESTFPRSQQILGELLADCTEEEKAKIVGGNAARVYHLN